MENATKALMIAAAVIVAILIISLVMGIFNTGAEQAQNANLDEYAILQHNDKFTKYEGENKSGSEVNAMLKAVRNYNNTQEDESMMITVADQRSDVEDGDKVDVDPDADSSAESPNTVATGARYQVKLYYSNNLVRAIVVADTDGTPSNPLTAE